MSILKKHDQSTPYSLIEQIQNKSYVARTVEDNLILSPYSNLRDENYNSSVSALETRTSLC
jgi:hypothetical protein